MPALKRIKNLSQLIWKPKRLNTGAFFVTSVSSEKCRRRKP